MGGKGILIGIPLTGNESSEISKPPTLQDKLHVKLKKCFRNYAQHRDFPVQEPRS